MEGIGLVQSGKKDAGLIVACNYLKGCSRDAARYFLALSADTTRDNGHKPAESQLRPLHLLNLDETLGKHSSPKVPHSCGTGTQGDDKPSFPEGFHNLCEKIHG